MPEWRRFLALATLAVVMPAVAAAQTGPKTTEKHGQWTIDGATMTVRAIGESPAGTLVDIPRLTPDGQMLRGPIEVTAAGG